MKVIWTERSVSSLEAIGDFISRDNPQAARRWLARLVDRAECAVTLPRAGRIVPEIGRDDVREVFVRSYRIVYQIRTDALYVLTIFEGSRLLRASDLDDLVDE